MKTTTISTPTHEIFLAELPQNAREPKLFNDKDRPYISYFEGAETPRFYLPEGDYKYLGFVSDLKESEVEPLVEKVKFKEGVLKQDIYFRDYSTDFESSFECLLDTALESFLSLLETKIYWENPYSYERTEYEKLADNNKWCRFISKEEFNFYDAHSRTFDKARTIVFVKEK